MCAHDLPNPIKYNVTSPDKSKPLVSYSETPTTLGKSNPFRVVIELTCL